MNNNESLLVKIGETSDGKIVKCDFSSVNNMLVSGTTGSGKTNLIYSLLHSLMENNDPSNIKFIIFASKISDYDFMSRSAYLLYPLISDPRLVERGIAVAYEEAAKRMEHRELDNSPHIFLIMDDFASAAEREYIIDAMRRLLMLTRLVKMHCILVTSIPTSSIVPSEVKALIPYRISFTTTSPQISRMVIGRAGAETLRYPGEMIYKCGNQMLTLDAAYSEDSINRIRIIDEKHRDEAEIDEDLRSALAQLESKKYSYEPEDELTEDAIAFMFKSGQISVSMIQRRFRIGYNRAARIIDEIEQKGLIGPQDGARPRQVLISEDVYYGSNANSGENEEPMQEDAIVFNIEIEDDKNEPDEWLGKNIFKSLSPEQQAKILDADYEDDY